MAGVRQSASSGVSHRGVERLRGESGASGAARRSATPLRSGRGRIRFCAGRTQLARRRLGRFRFSGQEAANPAARAGDASAETAQRRTVAEFGFLRGGIWSGDRRRRGKLDSSPRRGRGRGWERGRDERLRPGGSRRGNRRQRPPHSRRLALYRGRGRRPRSGSRRWRRRRGSGRLGFHRPRRLGRGCARGCGVRSRVHGRPGGVCGNHTDNARFLNPPSPSSRRSVPGTAPAKQNPVRGHRQNQGRPETP